MKKLFTLILAFVYLNVSAGVPVNIHYCMGDFESMEYGYAEDDECGKCGMTEKKGCCDTEVKVVKVDDAHQSALFASIAAPAPAILPLQDNGFFLYSPYSPEIIPESNSPPDYKTPDTFLLNCVFRI